MCHPLLKNLYSLLQMLAAVVFKLCSGGAVGGETFLSSYKVFCCPIQKTFGSGKGGTPRPLYALLKHPMACTHAHEHTHMPTSTSDRSGASTGLLRFQGEQPEMLGPQSQGQAHILACGLQATFPISSHHSYPELNICSPLTSLCLPNRSNDSVPLCFSS